MNLHDKVFNALHTELCRNDELHQQADEIITIVVEECAKVAENAKKGWTLKFIATAIRALKD